MADVESRSWRHKRSTREVRTEALPQEVRMALAQLKAANSDHEARIAQLERMNQALIAEAAAKVKGAA